MEDSFHLPVMFPIHPLRKTLVESPLSTASVILPSSPPHFLFCAPLCFPQAEGCFSLLLSNYLLPGLWTPQSCVFLRAEIVSYPQLFQYMVDAQ